MPSNSTAPNPDRATPVWLRHFSKLLVLATLVLIFLGGQVKSHEAGLSVPDWPTTYGQNMFTFPISQWVGNIYHEHIHRLVATAIGILCIVMALWLYLREDRAWVKWLGVAALLGVILQGVLGGITVLLFLPAWTSVSHGVLAQTFFMLTIFIAYALSRERKQRESEDSEAPESGWTPMAAPALFVLGAVYVQLILGALMRHTESGLAIPDFPMMGGQPWPFFTNDTIAWINQWRTDYSYETGIMLEDVNLGQIWIHFIHRVGAFMVTVIVGAAGSVAYLKRKSHPALWRTMMWVLLVVGVQLALGIATVLTQKVPLIASLHVACGAALLGLTTLMALRALPLSLSDFPRQPEDASMRSVSA